MEITVLDDTVGTILTVINGGLGYFVGGAISIGKFVFLFSLLMLSIKLAFGGAKFGDEMMKKIVLLFSFFIFLNYYPALLNGVKRLTYELPATAFYENSIRPQIENFVNDNASNAIRVRYSSILNPGAQTVGGGVIMRYYIKNPYNEEYNMLSPSMALRIVFLVCENFWNGVRLSGINDLGQSALYVILLIIAACCGILSILVYIISIIEFHLVAVVGVFTTGFMLWDGTKFISEKLFTAILGQAMKLLFLTAIFYINLSIMFSLMSMYPVGEELTLSAFLVTIFVSFLTLVLTLSAPQLANAFMTGTPQLGFQDLAVAAAGIVGAGAAAKKASQAAKGMGQTALRKGMGAAGNMTASLAAGSQAARNSGGGAGNRARGFAKGFMAQAGQNIKDSGSDFMAKRLQNIQTQPGSNGLRAGSAMTKASSRLDNASTFSQYFKNARNRGTNLAKGLNEEGKNIQQRIKGSAGGGRDKDGNVYTRNANPIAAVPRARRTRSQQDPNIARQREQNIRHINEQNRNR